MIMRRDVAADVGMMQGRYVDPVVNELKKYYAIDQTAWRPIRLNMVNRLSALVGAITFIADRLHEYE